MNWPKVCMPKHLGGLGIPNLQLLSIAFRVRWLWKNVTDQSKPWNGLPLPVDGVVRAVFHASTSISIHNGRDTSFWKSHWLQGVPLCDRFPSLFKHSRMRSLSVRQALPNRHWITMIKPNPSMTVLREYLLLWELLDSQPPIQFTEEPDSDTWRWTSSGSYSASSAYAMMFTGSIRSNVFPQVWKTKATPKCRLHAWLLLHDRCLTADNLAKRGWPCNPICSLCHIHPETAVHISAACSYA